MAENEITIDNYKLVNCLAQGRHSQVWEALDAGSSRSVALKLLLPEAYSDREQRQLLKYEAKVGKSLDHPNIIKMLECIVSRDHAYIAMELFRANNVKVQLRGNLNAVHLRARRLIEQTASALAHMHERGWIHKDVKPENILVNRASEVKLIDFSLAGKPAGSLGKMVNRKKKGTVQGTRTYMAPEQIRNQPLTPQTDIYGFGITVYEILAGRPPFRSPHPDDLLRDHLKTTPPEPSYFNPNITPEMDLLVLKMLAKLPKNRQASLDEFLSEFRNTQIFKEAIKEESEKTDEEKEAELLQQQDEGLQSRVDSRLDAMRTEARKRDPNYVPPPKPQPKKVAPKIEEPAPKPAAPPQPAQATPQFPPQQFPPQGMPMQAMTPEQQAMYHHMMQQYYQQAWLQQQQAMQNQMYPQGGMPPQPGMPHQAGMPQQPGMPMPPGTPMPEMPPAPAAGTPPQSPQQPPAAPAQPPTPPAGEQQAPPSKKDSQGTVMNIGDLEDMFNSLPDV